MARSLPVDMRRVVLTTGSQHNYRRVVLTTLFRSLVLRNNASCIAFGNMYSLTEVTLSIGLPIGTSVSYTIICIGG